MEVPRPAPTACADHGVLSVGQDPQSFRSIIRLLRGDLGRPGQRQLSLLLLAQAAILAAVGVGSVALLLTLVRLLGPWRQSR